MRCCKRVWRARVVRGSYRPHMHSDKQHLGMGQDRFSCSSGGISNHSFSLGPFQESEIVVVENPEVLFDRLGPHFSKHTRSFPFPGRSGGSRAAI